MRKLLYNGRHRCRTGLLTLLLLWVGTVSAFAGGMADIRINVRRTAEVKGNTIILGDVADIEAPSFLKNGLASLELGTAPDPGKILSLSGERVRRLIYAKPLVDESMAVSVPERLFVKRNSQPLSEADLKERFEQFLSSSMGYKEFEVTSFRCQGLDSYPAGELSVAVDKQYLRNHNGRFSLYMNVMVDGKKQDRINVHARVAVYKSVACAARHMRRGEKVGTDDVVFESRDIFSLRHGFMERISGVERMALKSDLDKGECLDAGMFKQVPVVHKGDIVKLVASKNRLSIETLGVCREDGFTDQIVQVENLTSGKVVRGQVQESGRVAILF